MVHRLKYSFVWKWYFLFPVTFYRTCYRPCSLDCAAGSPLLLQYKLLTLPSGIPPSHNVVRLSAFSESGILQQRTSFTILEQESETGLKGQVFGIRDEAGRGIIFTLRALDRAGLVRLKVQATTISLQGRITYQSIFIIYISVSAYPYWSNMLLYQWLCPPEVFRCLSFPRHTHKAILDQLGYA